ncbi:MAG: hypothetical protein ACXV0U_06280, partial [Kineosporiaceae bacterium]
VLVITPVIPAVIVPVIMAVIMAVITAVRVALAVGMLKRVPARAAGVHHHMLTGRCDLVERPAAARRGAWGIGRECP